MIVYRIEHATVQDARTKHACGPLADVNNFGRYRDAVAYAQDLVCDAMNGREDKPTPFWDARLHGINEDEICGTDSWRSLRFWFEDSIPALVAAGFRVQEYDVPDWACRVGESGQVVFKYAYATPVDEDEEEKVND